MITENTNKICPIKSKSTLSTKKTSASIHDVLRKDTDDEDDDDDDFEQKSINKSENSSKIKYLPPSVIKDIEQKNVARKLAGLPPILTTIRHCLTCGAKFQSAGNRTCGCTSRIAGTIAGREII